MVETQGACHRHSSCSVNGTSVDNPWIVGVAGTTIISLRCPMTSSRLRIRTGRRLSASRNVYQRISPRFAQTLPAFHLPGKGLLFRGKLLARRWDRAISGCIIALLRGRPRSRGVKDATSGMISSAARNLAIACILPRALPFAPATSSHSPARLARSSLSALLGLVSEQRARTKRAPEGTDRDRQ